MKLLSSDARNKAAFATSSGCPIRPKRAFGGAVHTERCGTHRGCRRSCQHNRAAGAHQWQCVLYGKQRAFHFHAKCVIKRPLRDRPGSIERIDHKEIPPKVEYSPTPFGRSLAQALGPLCRWGTDYTLAVERINERRMTALVQP